MSFPVGLSYAVVDPGIERAIRERFASFYPPEYPPAVRSVKQDGQVVARVLAIPLAGRAAEVRTGFLERARETGAPTKERDVRGAHVLQTTTPAGVVQLELLRCEMFVTVGADEESTDRIRAAAVPR